MFPFLLILHFSFKISRIDEPHDKSQAPNKHINQKAPHPFLFP